MRFLIAAGALALALASSDPAPAQRVKAGLLTCDVSGGLGFIVGSQKEVSCLFSPAQAGPQESHSETMVQTVSKRAASRLFWEAIWHRTAHERRVPGASRWWARSRAARRPCSKRFSPAPAQSSAKER